MKLLGINDVTIVSEIWKLVDQLFPRQSPTTYKIDGGLINKITPQEEQHEEQKVEQKEEEAALPEHQEVRKDLVLILSNLFWAEPATATLRLPKKLLPSLNLSLKVKNNVPMLKNKFELFCDNL